MMGTKQRMVATAGLLGLALLGGLQWGADGSTPSGLRLSLSSAQAYSSAADFDVAVGTKSHGGGGRYFTGSLRDGLTCGVCHQSEKSFEFEVDGLPDSIVPGKEYTISVSWEGDSSRVAFNAEIVGPKGLAAGTLAKVDAYEVDFSKLSGKREIFGFSPSPKKPSKIEVTWTAPTKDFEGPISLHVSGVRRQKDGTPEDSEKSNLENVLSNDELAVYAKQFAFGDSSKSKDKE